MRRAIESRPLANVRPSGMCTYRRGNCVSRIVCSSNRSTPNTVRSPHSVVRVPCSKPAALAMPGAVASVATSSSGTPADPFETSRSARPAIVSIVWSKDARTERLMRPTATTTCVPMTTPTSVSTARSRYSRSEGSVTSRMSQSAARIVFTPNAAAPRSREWRPRRAASARSGRSKDSQAPGDMRMRDLAGQPCLELVRDAGARLRVVLEQQRDGLGAPADAPHDDRPSSLRAVRKIEEQPSGGLGGRPCSVTDRLRRGTSEQRMRSRERGGDDVPGERLREAARNRRRLAEKAIAHHDRHRVVARGIVGVVSVFEDRPGERRQCQREEPTFSQRILNRSARGLRGHDQRPERGRIGGRAPGDAPARPALRPFAATEQRSVGADGGSSTRSADRSRRPAERCADALSADRPARGREARTECAPVVDPASRVGTATAAKPGDVARRGAAIAGRTRASGDSIGMAARCPDAANRDARRELATLERGGDAFTREGIDETGRVSDAYHAPRRRCGSVIIVASVPASSGSTGAAARNRGSVRMSVP